MKHILPLLTVVALSACEVGATPTTPGNTDDMDAAVVNQTAGLTAYPGARNAEVVPDGLDTRARFSADASLQEVYEHFNGELAAQGWQQTATEVDDDETEATYSREGRVLEFELERDDGGFELEIDIDGDNTGYDQDNGDDDDTGNDGDDDLN